MFTLSLVVDSVALSKNSYQRHGWFTMCGIS